MPVELFASGVLLSERKEVLRSFDGFADPAEQDLEILAALHEVNLGGMTTSKSLAE